MMNQEHDEPILIADSIYWVGYSDQRRNLHCNPYLIAGEGEALLIDGGSRTDFSTVMLKILQTGTTPDQIVRLIYQHYDPDLCSSIPNFEEIINRADLKIISHRENNLFIRYYGGKAPLLDIKALGNSFTLETGRRLSFHRTPYAHSAGSFMTYDAATETLFSSDLFGSYDRQWSLFLELPAECESCREEAEECQHTGRHCPVKGIINFHRRIMTSCKALSHAMAVVEELAPRIIAPQHGSIMTRKEDIQILTRRLKNLSGVGIDAFQ